MLNKQSGGTTIDQHSYTRLINIVTAAVAIAGGIALFVSKNIEAGAALLFIGVVAVAHELLSGRRASWAGAAVAVIFIAAITVALVRAGLEIQGRPDQYGHATSVLLAAVFYVLALISSSYAVLTLFLMGRTCLRALRRPRS